MLRINNNRLFLQIIAPSDGFVSLEMICHFQQMGIEYASVEYETFSRIINVFGWCMIESDGITI